MHFSGGSAKRVLVTGFDPFTLSQDVRQREPGGREFADGRVERAPLPHCRPGPRQVDTFVTTSQSRPGRFDLGRGGHVHTPVLDGLGEDPQELTTPMFEANRAAINDQVRSLVRVAAGTVSSR